MAVVIRTIPDIFKMYQEWVCANPRLTSDIESSIKWISYFLAGKVSDSTVLSELVYSISNLWVLLNDKIILNAQQGVSFNVNDNHNKIKTWLTVLEYSEVFIEITSRQVWGDKAKWVAIVIVQTFKCVLRLLLVLKYKDNVLQSPPISPLQRKKFVEENLSDGALLNSRSEGFKIESGRIIRTVDSATSSSRSWKPPTCLEKQEEKFDHVLSDSQRVGEVLYVVKPLVHLSSMYITNRKAWAPWLISLVMDVSSLSLLHSLKDNEDRKISVLWTQRQLFELQRRKFMLLFYLLRSPFYDRYTKNRLNKLLLALAQSIPLVGIVLKPLAEYLPHWQDTHLYMWSS